MTKLQAVSLGAVIAMGLSVMRIATAADETIAEANATLERIEERQAPVSVAEQFSKDIDRLIEEEEIEVKKGAPYETIGLADEYQIYLEELCSDMEINFFLAIALIESESSYDPGAVGDSGNSYGLCQINKVWWNAMEEDYGLDITEPLDNIEAGMIILKDLMTKYPDDIALVLQCYKAGEYRGRELYNQGIILEAVENVVTRAMTIENEAQH